MSKSHKRSRTQPLESGKVAPDGAADDRTPEPVEIKPATSARAGTKQAQLIEMLGREGGVSLDEISAATAWLPHSARAMLTGLRKRGLALGSDKVDGIRRYRIEHAPSE